MKTMRVIGVAAIVLTAACVIAQQRYDMIVRQDFFAGFAGNKEALARGMKVTEETLAKDPNHAEANVWHGSGLLFLSGPAFQGGDVQNGMKLWQQGLGEMEHASRVGGRDELDGGGDLDVVEPPHRALQEDAGVEVGARARRPHHDLVGHFHRSLPSRPRSRSG